MPLKIKRLRDNQAENSVSVCENEKIRTTQGRGSIQFQVTYNTKTLTNNIGGVQMTSYVIKHNKLMPKKSKSQNFLDRVTRYGYFRKWCPLKELPFRTFRVKKSFWTQKQSL